MTNIEKLLEDAGASVASRKPQYVEYDAGGAFVIVRLEQRTWTAYVNAEAVSSEQTEAKARETLSSFREKARRLEELVSAMRGLENPWGEAPSEEALLTLGGVRHLEGSGSFTFSEQPRSNRFELFDRHGVRVDARSVLERPDAMSIPVLKTAVGGYAGYGVGFPVTHVMLDFDCGHARPGWDKLRFGGIDESL